MTHLKVRQVFKHLITLNYFTKLYSSILWYNLIEHTKIRNDPPY